MTDRFFLDTNILVYANDGSAPGKQERARELVALAYSSRQGHLSTQVLQEFFVAVTRKAGVPPANARHQVLRLMELPTVRITEELVLAAIDLHLSRGLSFWDALVVRAAAAAGCNTLYTEDMDHGATIDGVRMLNPFLSP